MVKPISTGVKTMRERNANTLTPKQSYFCRCVAGGLTLSDAYREAYDTQNMKVSTVHREAHALMAHPKITARVEWLQRQKDRALIAASISDRERILGKLRHLIDTPEGGAAKRTGNGLTTVSVVRPARH